MRLAGTHTRKSTWRHIEMLELPLPTGQEVKGTFLLFQQMGLVGSDPRAVDLDRLFNTHSTPGEGFTVMLKPNRTTNYS